ncbi:methylamine utilization protein MauG [Sedimenticola thiotaurini]|uniref:Methylamine utilization protein MauG n=2 Tax=Sedimenticola thiotaurini TaxID=1543721 RepID=A0A0F7K4I4_9GAMM|nr:cytochrome c peroxidase [Sedimenticola thiotaurini]AKH22105.1 methylamine utilization protein MauG [Sedimenticola thiotaurini]
MGSLAPLQAEAAFDSVEALGQALFFDTNLSRNRTQSCATCHSPNRGFVDDRDNGVGGAVSLGDDGKSLGDRNAPSAAYAAFSPPFHLNDAGSYVGGQFLDGREDDLAGQAGGPPLNPIEMAMPDKISTVQRLMENDDYVTAFKTFYGDAIFNDPEQAYSAMAKSIAAFEKTEFFAPFDSKYDRYLRGEYELTPQEDLGMTLFFSKQFTNCNLCHQLKRLPGSEGETFSNYEYHNIGTPVNVAVRKLNGMDADYVDRGLLDNPKVDDPGQAGKFKVPTLRNVAVTGPYMHNGVFKDLRTVVLFYNKYNSRSAQRQINPETGKPWAAAEIAENISLEELETGPALDDKRIDALVAFLKTLTDRRYEKLLE